jgi:hypothetical protein
MTRKTSGGPGVVPDIALFAILQKGEIGQRLGDFTQPHRILDKDRGGVSRRENQNLVPATIAASTRPTARATR